MEAPLQTIRDQQRDTWNAFSGGWKKYNPFTMNFLQPMGNAIIAALAVKPTDVVLDIASGTGEPAFTIANLAGKGKVYATDVSEQMLQVAENMAAERGITNIAFTVADVSELPFEAYFAHKISCRMGFMFFPDMQLAANEMYRVCKEGGVAATSVWGAPQDNSWIGTALGVLGKIISPPPATPGAPGMFRCAQPGLMKSIFENAGFTDVQEQTVAGAVDYGTIDDYWQMMSEVSPPLAAAMRTAGDTVKQQLKEGIYAACTNKVMDGRLVLHYSAIIISGVK